MNQSKCLNAPLVAFCLIATVGLSHASYPQHVWSDYYIIYSAGKNLATGRGLPSADRVK